MSMKGTTNANEYPRVTPNEWSRVGRKMNPPMLASGPDYWNPFGTRYPVLLTASIVSGAWTVICIFLSQLVSSFTVDPVAKSLVELCLMVPTFMLYYTYSGHCVIGLCNPYYYIIGLASLSIPWQNVAINIPVDLLMSAVAYGILFALTPAGSTLGVPLPNDELTTFQVMGYEIIGRLILGFIFIYYIAINKLTLDHVKEQNKKHIHRRTLNGRAGIVCAALTGAVVVALYPLTGALLNPWKYLIPAAYTVGVTADGCIRYLAPDAVMVVGVLPIIWAVIYLRKNHYRGTDTEDDVQFED